MSAIDPAALGIGRLFHVIRDAAIVGDPITGEIILWNEAAARIFGYTTEEAVGSLLEMLVPDELKDRHRTGRKRYSTTGHGPLIDSAQVVELPAVRKDGTEITIELTLTPIEGETIQGRFAIALIRDVTERKRYSIELERANQAMRDFVAVASHDLRAPVTSIHGFASTLGDAWDRTADDEKKEYLGTIERQAERLSLLVNDLLALSELEAGAVSATPSEVSVKEMVQKAIELLLPEDGVDVFVPAGLTVTADPDHLERIITNYIGNAIKYGEPPIEVKASVQGEFVEIRVCDAGEGVPEEFVSRLFEKFARADSTVTRKEQGSGLGLSIVRGLAQAKGGEAWYEPNKPKGACFGVRVRKRAEPGS